MRWFDGAAMDLESLVKFATQRTRELFKDWEGLVTHVVARKLVDRTPLLGTLVTHSRDFR